MVGLLGAELDGAGRPLYVVTVTVDGGATVIAMLVPEVEIMEVTAG